MAYLTTALVITRGETNTNMLQPVHNVCHIMDYLCFIPEMYRRDTAVVLEYACLFLELLEEEVEEWMDGLLHPQPGTK